MPSRNLFITGMVYGIVVWLVMNLVVLPLSNVRHGGGPFDLPQAIVGAVILMFCIGLPIATIVGRYYARRAPAPERIALVAFARDGFGELCARSRQV